MEVGELCERGQGSDLAAQHVQVQPDQAREGGQRSKLRHVAAAEAQVRQAGRCASIADLLQQRGRRLGGNTQSCTQRPGSTPTHRCTALVSGAAAILPNRQSFRRTHTHPV